MGFNRNYFKQTNNIFNLKLKPNQFTILSYLIRMANEAENCYPSMNNIAEMCCVSKSTVVKTIEELEESGFITVNIDSKYNVYVINYDSIETTNNRPEKTKKTKRVKSTPTQETSKRNPLIVSDCKESGIQIEIEDTQEKTDAEAVIRATDCAIEKAKEVLEYAVTCNKKNPIGFAIKAIEGNWKLENKETNGVNPRSFNNFEPRQYDYSKLESMLLGYEDYSEEDIHEVLGNKKNGNYTSNNSERFNGVEIGTNVAV